MNSAKQLKIVYSSAPVDATSVYMHWVLGQDDPSHFAITYAQHFYELAKKFSAKSWLISSRDKKGLIQDNDFRVEFRSLKYQSRSSMAYFAGQFWSGLRLIFSVILFKADILIVTEDRTFWFLLGILPLFGIKIIPTIHCTLWPKYKRPSAVQQIIQKLNSWFFRYGCVEICVVSEDIKDQIVKITNGRSRPIRTFVPAYRKEFLDDIKSRNYDAESDKFQVLFAGRVESSKGIYLLLEVAKRFILTNPNCVFNICGTGSQVEKLKAAALEAGIEKQFVLHGHCDRNKLRKMYEMSHVIAVPTTKDFVEGFNKVVAEGVIMGKPIVTSPVCPALSVVRDAAVEVAPDNVDDYLNAILKLATDKEFYRQKQKNALALREQFFSYSKSWEAQVEDVVRKICRSNLDLSKYGRKTAHRPLLNADSKPNFVPKEKTAKALVGLDKVL
ncbi:MULTISPECIES: glycosyltransferase family 4 protein [Cyanophyceae]|uniref:Glycosyltransferase family 4 protein n=1 Tax=Leptolyngbya subtilissima DQ-A4 TaxID=2933933 RepID=A0ABV0JY08_9CYAN|nr:glycosyltransferase family 4 protein [Nodosilinea sp. FACHB-141]MBD2112034.1 glycosyltransferase family 4 protein [Nodosilinea sp. FACHB-141]